MSIQRTHAINDYVSQLTVPAGYTLTDDARAQFYQALDIANEYRGEPTSLIRALELFRRTDHAGLFFAGVAYVHLQAAYLQGFSYSEAGMSQARSWLERALQLMPKIVELLLVETFIALRARQLPQAQELIARLVERDPQQFYVLLAQLEYAGLMMAITDATTLFERTLAAATTPSQEIYARNRIARYQMLFGNTAQAAETYVALTRLTPTDPWIWHNLSVLASQRYHLRQAWRCNARALELMEFENARRLRRKIIRQYAIVVLGSIVVGAAVLAYLITAIAGLYYH